MKTNLIVPFVIVFVVTALVGCASTDRSTAAASLGAKNYQGDDASFTTAAALPEATNNFSALDENGDGLIDSAEFLRQVPNYSKPHRFFGDTNSINQFDPLRDPEAFHPSEAFHSEGLQLFSIHF